MNKLLSILVVLLLGAMSVAATEYTLTYQGFPYKKTQCADPTYPSGARVKLSSATIQNSEGVELTGWKYKRQTYPLGATFTMPAMNVELIPVWGKNQAIDETESDNVEPASKKILRNGQLIIIRGGIEYDVLGRRL